MRAPGGFLRAPGGSETTPTSPGGFPMRLPMLLGVSPLEVWKKLPERLKLFQYLPNAPEVPSPSSGGLWVRLLIAPVRVRNYVISLQRRSPKVPSYRSGGIQGVSGSLPGASGDCTNTPEVNFTFC